LCLAKFHPTESDHDFEWTDPTEQDACICDTWQGKELQVAKKRVGKYALSFRQMAMEQMKDCPSVSALAEELGVHRTVLYHWQR
jgi:hypothetical protein